MRVLGCDVSGIDEPQTTHVATPSSSVCGLEVGPLAELHQKYTVEEGAATVVLIGAQQAPDLTPLQGAG